MPILTDYNGDSLTDLYIGAFGRYDAWATFTPLFGFYRNVGTEFQPIFEWDSTISGDYGQQALPEGHSPAFGDLDQDGDTDLLIGHEDGKLSWFENIGGMGMSPVFTFRNSNYEGIDVGSFAAPDMVDLDKDGRIDLVIGEQNGNLNYFRNTGTAGTPSYTLVTDSLGKIDVSAAGTFGQAFSLPRFFEQHGKTELAIGMEAGWVHHYTDVNANPGAVFTLVDSSLAQVDVGIRSAPALADLNGDDWLELVVGNYGGGVNLFMGKDPATHRNPAIGISLPRITVFPNPVQHQFTILVASARPAKGQWRLRDAMGRLIQFGSFDSDPTLVNTSGRASGIYFLEVQLNGQVFSTRYGFAKVF